MKDLSREDELRQLISSREKISEKEKWVRVKRTFFVLSGVVYLVALALGEMREAKEYLGWLIAAPIFAGLIMFGAMLVLLYILSGATREEKYIAKLEGELHAIMRFNGKKDEL